MTKCIKYYLLCKVTTVSTFRVFIVLILENYFTVLNTFYFRLGAGRIRASPLSLAEICRKSQAMESQVHRSNCRRETLLVKAKDGQSSLFIAYPKCFLMIARKARIFTNFCEFFEILTKFCSFLSIFETAAKTA